MKLPSFNKNGILPRGVYECQFSEAKNLLVRNEKRKSLWDKFEQFLNWIRPMNFFEYVYIDGSYITDKEEPNDIDIVLEINNSFSSEISSVDRKVFDHNYVLNNFSLDAYISPSKNNFSEFFQYVGVKEGLSRGLNPKDKKGILKVKI